ncbi:MAG: hypothetical protein QS721_04170 [Candidatus Endonucleobacter sp. (ex Gigantidas childressi)]|nr:hypothetical protein [Candidatus Endonucleobacter sp. (ex Gigantidas childressi)]
MLAAFANPDHLLLVGSRGLAYLLPSSNLKCFGYSYKSIYLHIWANWRRSLHASSSPGQEAWKATKRQVNARPDKEPRQHR